MDATFMPPATLLEVLSALEGFDPLDARWAKRNLSLALRRDVIAHVGKHPAGVECAVRDLAWRMGRNSVRHVADAINELVARRVLLVEQDAAGCRPRFMRVNPFIGDWHATRWRRDPRALVDVIFGGDIVAHCEIASRPPSRHEQDLRRDPPRDAIERRPTIASRPVSRRNGSLVSREPRDAIGARPQKQFPASVRGEDSLGACLGEQGREEIAPEVMGLANTLKVHNGWRYVAGEPLERIARLAALYSVEHLAAAAAHVAPNRGNPLRFLQELELAAAPVIEIPELDEPAATEPAPALATYEPELVDVAAPDVAAAAMRAARASLGVTPPRDTEAMAVGGGAP
jgi:hypothetical protein